jgi:uncharacterized protein YggE
MKKSVALISIIILAVFFAGLALAERPTISVVGKGVVKVPADMTMITIGLDSTKNNQTEAEVEVQQKLNQTMNALIAAGLNEEEILPSQANSISSLQSKSCNTINNTTTCSYYNLTRLGRTLVVQMKTTDQTKVNNVLQAAKSVNASASVTAYGLSDQDKPMKQAIKKADENALAKADAYAVGEGYRLGKLLQRNEIPPWLCSLGDLDSLDLDSSSEPGVVKVSACVEATYELLT